MLLGGGRACVRLRRKRLKSHGKEEQEDKAVREKINYERNESKQEHQKEKYFQTNTQKRKPKTKHHKNIAKRQCIQNGCD